MPKTTMRIESETLTAFKSAKRIYERKIDDDVDHSTFLDVLIKFYIDYEKNHIIGEKFQ